jgi:hypothetical protein
MSITADLSQLKDSDMVKITDNIVVPRAMIVDSILKSLGMPKTSAVFSRKVKYAAAGQYLRWVEVGAKSNTTPDPVLAKRLEQALDDANAEWVRSKLNPSTMTLLLHRLNGMPVLKRLLDLEQNS